MRFTLHVLVFACAGLLYFGILNVWHAVLRAHPKACQMSQGEEEELATKFKEGFKAFDVAL